VGRVGLGGECAGGWVGGWILHGNWKRCVEFTSKEGLRRAIDEAVDGGDEGPSDDSVDGDVFTECDAEGDGVAIGEEVREVVSNDGTQESDCDSVGDSRGVWLCDGSGESDGLEGCGRVVKFDEGFNTGWVSCGDVFVVGVDAAVETGAGVKKGGERRVSGVGAFAEVKSDGG
jgi:hypothetical protein